MESLAQQGLTAGQQQAAMALLKQRAEQKRQEDEDSLQAAIASGQKRRGRPPGSKNRPRDDGRALLLAANVAGVLVDCPEPQTAGICFVSTEHHVGCCQMRQDAHTFC